MDPQRLYKTLNYRFNDPQKLKQALTHCSMGADNNERYEFLGDAILSMVISNALFSRFPAQTEGELSRLRAYLVKGETLASLAADIKLGDHLYLGQGELKSGGFRRASILADALEALFAAVYLDGGFAASEAVILHLYQHYLNDKALHHNVKDFKTQLQEHVQQHKRPLPHYTLERVVGEEHEQCFHIKCTVATHSALGTGDTRRKAEQMAAKELLAHLKKKI